jgi:hypothetical protein
VRAPVARRIGDAFIESSLRRKSIGLVIFYFAAKKWMTIVALLAMLDRLEVRIFKDVATMATKHEVVCCGLIIGTMTVSTMREPLAFHSARPSRYDSGMSLPVMVKNRIVALWESGAKSVDLYPGAVENFPRYVEISSDGECWLWTGTKHAGSDDAPEFTWTWPDGRQRNRRVPKLIYELAHQRQIGPNVNVVQNDKCHGGRFCLRPEHLREQSRVGRKRGSYSKSA